MTSAPAAVCTGCDHPYCGCQTRAPANPPTPSLECPSCHGLNLSCPDGCGRDPATGELNGTKLVPTPSPVSGEVTRDKLVRLLYDAWPNTVFSQHLSDLTGLPIDSVLDFDSAAKAGATFGGIERYADVILPLFAATAQAGEVERLREAITPSGDTKAAYMGEFSFTIMQTEEDEDGDMVDRPVNVLVPWTTIKEIMAAIGARALASGDVAKGEG